ncbi:cyclohexyl-isocyanide hydratase [Aneurinibacillus soli]|uniref:Isonitrile hydratase n=1 Tax=Aneurinibacillus soli TaxID=1500254 RepID=A0A0U4WK24_9BACL|nr:DJ-1/PfpI family protein [Aneurinibacillus soli]PYE63069.1 cyclohexyl-isocyanide hydratase [Aneurinibacillus soli]BAU28872.1 Isonitrile hydratase [Aneurinibacillus soli]
MKIAFILFEQVTSLDFVGFYDGITRLKTMGFIEDLSWDLCAFSEQVNDDRGITYNVHNVRPDLSAYDLIFIPGGMGTRTLIHVPEFIDWIKTAKEVPYKVSVCTGSLLLGAAGFLEGKKATTHPSASALLSLYTEQIKNERIVRDGNIITGGGVATSVDLGLYICELFAGKEAVMRIQKQMDYPYYSVGVVTP